ncbi:MAG: hypothetical protein WC679_00650 [Bacteroidales bacterium]|jgi:hypothetical protein
MKREVLVTKESLQALLDNEDKEFVIRVVGKALIILFKYQTEEEKKKTTTIENNGVGFTGADGRSGVLSAKSYLKNQTLLDWQLERWLKKNEKGYARLTKYHAQLNKAAIRKKMDNEEKQIDPIA